MYFLDGNKRRCGIFSSLPVSCHFRDCKVLLVTNLTDVNEYPCLYYLDGNGVIRHRELWYFSASPSANCCFWDGENCVTTSSYFKWPASVWLLQASVNGTLLNSNSACFGHPSPPKSFENKWTLVRDHEKLLQSSFTVFSRREASRCFKLFSSSLLITDGASIAARSYCCHCLIDCRSPTACHSFAVCSYRPSSGWFGRRCPKPALRSGLVGRTAVELHYGNRIYAATLLPRSAEQSWVGGLGVVTGRNRTQLVSDHTDRCSETVPLITPMTTAMYRSNLVLLLLVKSQLVVI